MPRSRTSRSEVNTSTSARATGDVSLAHAPAIMVNTPGGTRGNPNGASSPTAGSRKSASVTGGGGGNSSYYPRPYNPADYASVAGGPSPWASNNSGMKLLDSGRKDDNNDDDDDDGKDGKDEDEEDENGSSSHDSPSQGEKKGKKDPSRGMRSGRSDKQGKGAAASFYAGGASRPTTSFPPAMVETSGATAYSMSGALPTATTTAASGVAAMGNSFPGPAHPSQSHSQAFPPPPNTSVNSALIYGDESVVTLPNQGGFFSGRRPGRHSGSQQQMQTRERGLRARRVDTESALRRYVDLQQRVALGASAEDKEALKRVAGMALDEVKDLRREIGAVVKKKEGGRVGRFIVGGIVAGTIPIVKHFFRRPTPSPSSPSKAMTKTEYAFEKSRTMIGKILSAMHKSGWVAGVFAFVLAALYVFQAEVIIRVARTLHKRLKKLLIKMEEGERLGRDGMVVMEPRDLECLTGWRWRVLLWSK